MGQPMFPFLKEGASHPESSDSEVEVGWRCSHSECCVHLGGVIRQCKMLNKKRNSAFSIVKVKSKGTSDSGCSNRCLASQCISAHKDGLEKAHSEGPIRDC